VAGSSYSGGDTALFQPPSEKPATSSGPETLRDRADLLREINLVRQDQLPERRVFLVVINIADTKKYDEIIRVFGYKFADDLLSIRLADLETITRRQSAFRVGFWSVGLVFQADDERDYDAALARLIGMLAKPVICRGIPVSIKGGVGVCDLARGLGAAEDLLQATFLAGQAGAELAVGWSECNYDLSDDHRRAFALIAEAEASLGAEFEFELSYQARVDLRAWRCIGAEALLRWHHPTLGLVMPGEFIPLIEMTGLVRELTVWVLTRAVSQTAKWHADGFKLKTCVNISAKNLAEADFVERLALLLQKHALAPEFLELEFSEKHRFENMDDAEQRLRDLRDLGVGLSLDDFGTGANGFTSLETIPASVVKIDRRLINSVVDNAKQQALVKSLIRMAHEMGMQVVAEGLESATTQKMLQDWGCDAAQGFLINRPMPAEAFISWLSKTFVA
jgi:EAL domain-containing protein (putative c-di-GMP-specific phosphodiesterase class I)